MKVTRQIDFSKFIPGKMKEFDVEWFNKKKKGTVFENTDSHDFCRWLGWYDGEGHVGTSVAQSCALEVCFTSTDEDVLEWVDNFLKGCVKNKRPQVEKHHKPNWTLRIKAWLGKKATDGNKSRRVYELLELMFPFLSARRQEQIRHALEMQNIWENHPDPSLVRHLLAGFQLINPDYKESKTFLKQILTPPVTGKNGRTYVYKYYSEELAETFKKEYKKVLKR